MWRRSGNDTSALVAVQPFLVCDPFAARLTPNTNVFKLGSNIEPVNLMSHWVTGSTG